MAIEEYPTRRIDEVKADRPGAIAIGPFGSRMKSDTYTPIGIPVIRGMNISGTSAFAGDFVYISEADADSLTNCNVYDGDLVFPHRGNIGDVGIVRGDQARYVISSSLMKLSVDRNLIDPLFLFSWFRSTSGRHALLANASQVGTPGIATPLASLRQIIIPVPPLAIQKRIASILGALDDKIELNRRMNGTLEGMARALFQSWFVDFDPVRAKQAGRAPANLDPATAALFPADFETSELGEIPKGWHSRRLNEIAEIIMGTSPPGDTYNDSGAGTALINGPVEFGPRFPVKSKWTTATVREAQRGDLIFCVRGSTTGRRVIADDVYGLGRGVCAIRGRGRSQPYVNELIEHELPRLLEKTTGSVFPSLSAPDLREFSILCPPQAIVDDFVSIVGALHKEQDRLELESRTLASLRDVLLPQLLSGALSVDQIDLVEGA